MGKGDSPLSTSRELLLGRPGRLASPAQGWASAANRGVYSALAATQPLRWHVWGADPDSANSSLMSLLAASASRAVCVAWLRS